MCVEKMCSAVTLGRMYSNCTLYLPYDILTVYTHTVRVCSTVTLGHTVHVFSCTLYLLQCTCLVFNMWLLSFVKTLT